MWQKQAGGRAGDAPSNRLAERLRELPFSVGRLKTGTPPRIDGKSVNYAGLEIQAGDTPRPVMSYMGSTADHPAQMNCYITHTSAQTHDIIRGGLDRSPLFTGEIDGIGPRYCPSIEDKVVRFADKDSHQIFIEPEGLNTHELYPNGISTSLPFDVQMELVRSIKGFESLNRRWRPDTWEGCFLLARLMAQRGTRRLRRRVLSPALTPRTSASSRRLTVRLEMKLISVF